MSFNNIIISTSTKCIWISSNYIFCSSNICSNISFIVVWTRTSVIRKFFSSSSSLIPLTISFNVITFLYICSNILWWTFFILFTIFILRWYIVSRCTSRRYFSIYIWSICSCLINLIERWSSISIINIYIKLIRSIVFVLVLILVLIISNLNVNFIF